MRSLEDAIIALLNEERFMGEVIANMTRISSTQIPTAGVRIKDKVELVINEEWFNTHSLATRVAILRHEADHILHNHIPRFKKLAPELDTADKNRIKDVVKHNVKFKTLNVAADLAINCNIKNLPKEGCFPSQLKLPDGESMEYYYSALKDDMEDTLQKIEAMDDHGMWMESDGSPEELEEKIKAHANKAAERTRNAGRMSSNDELLLSRLNYKPKDWKADLRRFVANVTDSRTTPTRKRRNRRYGIQQPGYVKEDVLRIGVAIDTSGSMSDEQINQAMAEVGKIAETAEVWVVEADTEIKNYYQYDPRKIYKVTGRGGTAYQPAIDFFAKERKNRVDGLIYIGDMDCFDEVITKPSFPVMWAIIGNQSPPADFGYRTKIEVAFKGVK